MSHETIRICQFGAGRIGAVHAANVTRNPDCTLRYVVDVNAAAAQSLAEEHGAKVCGADAALADEDVDAVIIASSTNTHADLIEAAARAGKAVFCEKPIDLDLARVDAALKVVAEHKTILLVGFNRRYDPHFQALHAAIGGGRIGKVELVAITSRDPEPPPTDYIRVSGGLFRDMMIHDLDMARWLLGEEPVEVFAAASCLVDGRISEAGDVDTAVVTLKTAGGALCQISNSRRAVYGYDQRIEVFGSKGMLRVENPKPTTLESLDADGTTGDKPLHFFLERYAEAYRRELSHFVDCVATGAAPLTGAEAGRRALVLADAASESLASGRPIRV
ncbi:MAG: inositol 2-dehydrogenase [Proteobacteria bacterium]|nr:inositol 2-dehydrogenase [Pseudomonadota bacterium]